MYKLNELYKLGSVSIPFLESKGYENLRLLGKKWYTKEQIRSMAIENIRKSNLERFPQSYAK